MDNPTTTQYAGLMHNFILKARSTVREIDSQNDLTFLRIRSKKNEIMVAPGKKVFHTPLRLSPARHTSCSLSGRLRTVLSLQVCERPQDLKVQS